MKGLKPQSNDFSTEIQQNPYGTAPLNPNTSPTAIADINLTRTTFFPLIGSLHTIFVRHLTGAYSNNFRYPITIFNPNPVQCTCD